jgi:hypothetical protein
LPLSNSLIFFLENLGGLPGELWVDSPAELNISLHLFHLKIGIASFIFESVHVYDMSSDLIIFIIIFFIEDDEEDVKTRHDWSRNVDVESQRSVFVVSS